MEILVSPLFLRHFRKLSRDVQEKARRREKVFRGDPFDPRLDTHKLHGRLREEWAYSVDYSYRVAFLFLPNGRVLYTDVGTHDELY